MLKITPVGPVNHSVTLLLEGRLVGPWVEELRRACEPALAGGRALNLHLADVEFAEPSGIAALIDLRSRGATFLDVPPFVAQQLKAASGSA
jgi:hypothetical protein